MEVGRRLPPLAESPAHNLSGGWGGTMSPALFEHVQPAVHPAVEAGEALRVELDQCRGGGRKRFGRRWRMAAGHARFPPSQPPGSAAVTPRSWKRGPVACYRSGRPKKLRAVAFVTSITIDPDLAFRFGRARWASIRPRRAFQAVLPQRKETPVRRILRAVCRSVRRWRSRRRLSAGLNPPAYKHVANTKKRPVGPELESGRQPRRARTDHGILT